MAHYAKVLDGKVLEVIVAEKEFIDSYVDTVPGEWIQTSYNTFGNKHQLGGTPLRKNYAAVGGNYDKEGDFFYDEQPFPSWLLSKDTGLWEPPVSYPDDGKEYVWNEDKKSWDEVDYL
tara:strand:+ start:136 stop:489 length:354 start_codon:yes stop_codon:yes gene_type:complete